MVLSCGWDDATISKFDVCSTIFHLSLLCLIIIYILCMSTLSLNCLLNTYFWKRRLCTQLCKHWMQTASCIATHAKFGMACVLPGQTLVITIPAWILTHPGFVVAITNSRQWAGHVGHCRTGFCQRSWLIDVCRFKYGKLETLRVLTEIPFFPLAVGLVLWVCSATVLAISR